MKTIVVVDRGHVFNLLCPEQFDLPQQSASQEPANVRFLRWWKDKCRERNIPYTYRVAEPQGLRIVKHLLKKYKFEDLQKYSIYLMQEKVEELRENPNHFVILTGNIERIRTERNTE